MALRFSPDYLQTNQTQLYIDQNHEVCGIQS